MVVENARGPAVESSLRNSFMTTRVRPLGPTFLSYRVSDGRAYAESLAWALRAAGIPVWHDETDLPPGDTRHRLQEALASGLSGAVLVVTPELADSAVVRDVEVPAILALAADPAFSFAIASTVEDPAHSGHLDFAAPDQLLRLPPDSLRPFKQYGIPADTGTIARDLARRRMRVHHELLQATLEINLQTRLAPQAEVSGSGLVVRTRPPTDGRRCPPGCDLGAPRGFPPEPAPACGGFWRGKAARARRRSSQRRIRAGSGGADHHGLAHGRRRIGSSTVG